MISGRGVDGPVVPLQFVTAPPVRCIMF